MSTYPDKKDPAVAKDMEKNTTGLYDNVTLRSDGEDSDIANEFSPEEQRAITRRVDRRLVTTVGVMYCVSLMDRTNLSAANIAGYV